MEREWSSLVDRITHAVVARINPTAVSRSTHTAVGRVNHTWNYFEMFADPQSLLAGCAKSLVGSPAEDRRVRRGHPVTGCQQGTGHWTAADSKEGKV